MPEANDTNRGNILRGGEFYSPVQARLLTGDVLLSDLRQPCSRNVPRHKHELAYVTVMLQGDYLEGDRGHLDEIPPFTAVFNPSGAAHATAIGPAGASFFTIEFRQEGLRQLEVRLPQRVIIDRAGIMLWPGLRLYSAFKAGSSEPLALEACILEVIAGITGLEAAGKTAPPWFRRVKERLHDGFREPLRMKDLAREAGVHPVHLARVFRKFEKRTPGEYQQQLQVRAGCELLRDPQWPLSAIAVECGFADQSHFTRVFRRMAGATPAQFRRALAPRAPKTV